MIGLTIMVPVTVYQELIARNERDAVKQVKKMVKKEKIPEKYEVDFMDELKIQSKYFDFSGEKVTVVSAGRASQYHSDQECELCAEVNKPKKKAIF